MEEEVRTIFFNGPRGLRWVKTAIPTTEAANHEGCPDEESCPDDRAGDRRRFFGFLNAIHTRLEQHGISPEHVRRCYAQRFAMERPVDRPEPDSDEVSQPGQESEQKMSRCSQREWAIAAAEVQAMFQSPEVFADRIAWLKSQTLGPRPETQPSSDRNDEASDSRSPQIAFQEQLQREEERCERAILKRLYATPARIEDLDKLGFPKPLINRVLYALLHQERATFHGFTYFYHYLRAFKDQKPSRNGIGAKQTL